MTKTLSGGDNPEGYGQTCRGRPIPISDFLRQWSSLEQCSEDADPRLQRVASTGKQERNHQGRNREGHKGVHADQIPD